MSRVSDELDRLSQLIKDIRDGRLNPKVTSETKDGITTVSFSYEEEPPKTGENE